MSGIRGKPKGGFATEFERELRRARVAAGKVVGRKAVKDRLDGLKARNAERIGGGVRSAKSRSERWRQVNKGGQLSRARRSNVKAKYDNKDGLLVLLDLYPYAQQHEDGATLRPTSGQYLYIQDKRRRPRQGDNIFITKNGAVMAVKKRRKRRGNGPKPKEPVPRLVGVLRRKVEIQPMKDQWRLDTIGARYLDEYRDEIEKNIYGGV